MQAILKMPRDRDEMIVLARVFEQLELFPEMAAALRKSIYLDPQLDDEEREMIAVAMKHIVTHRRASLRIAQSALLNEQAQELQNDKLIEQAEAYVHLISDEIAAASNKFLDLIANTLVPAADSTEAHVFYSKLQGDYSRYLAELSLKESDISKAHDFYARANDRAMRELRPLHPLRLGTALNTAVFFYELRRDTERALHVARHAYEEAIADDNAGDVDEDQRREATHILRVVHENMVLWQEELGEWDPDLQQSQSVS